MEGIVGDCTAVEGLARDCAAVDCKVPKAPTKAPVKGGSNIEQEAQ